MSTENQETAVAMVSRHIASAISGEALPPIEGAEAAQLLAALRLLVTLPADPAERVRRTHEHRALALATLAALTARIKAEVHCAAAVVRAGVRLQ